MTVPRFELTPQRQKVLRLPTEPPGDVFFFTIFSILDVYFILVESSTLYLIVLRYACAPAPTRSSLNTVCVFFLKKNLNASRHSEHSPVRGKNVKGGIIGCKDKTSSWHLNGFPDGSNIGSTV